MVSPSKKRQIKGRVTTGHKIERKGEKGNSKLPYKPLSNKKYYLDIKSEKTRTSITADILKLGGVVEEFLSREVNYVISLRGQQSAGGSSSEQQQQQYQQQQASPLTPHQPLSSLPSTSHDSPLNLDSPREDTGKKRVRTRAEVLLERACVRRQGTSDVLENARLWSIPVWPLTKLVKWLNVLKESDKYKSSKANGLLASKTTTATSTTTTTTPSSSYSKITRLRAPYVKVEAFSRQYKPLYKELSSWPELNLRNPPGTSLFAEPKHQTKPKQQIQQQQPQPQAKSSSPGRPKQQQQQQQKQQQQSQQHRNTNTRRVRERGGRGVRSKESGYCELCSASYTSLKLHLKSDSHTEFVRNNKNYLYLDELITGQKQNCQLLGESR